MKHSRRDIVDGMADDAKLREAATAQPSLVEAAQEGALQRVRQLLDDGADVNAVDADGCSALQLAAAEGHREIAVLLLANGADPTILDNDKFTLLHWATFSNDPAILDLASSDDLEAPDRDGRRPLGWAASEGAQASVAWLLAHGADPNAPDKDGWTPLHFAVSGNFPELLTPLVGAGANVNARSKTGETPSELAERLEYREALSVLRSFVEN